MHSDTVHGSRGAQASRRTAIVGYGDHGSEVIRVYFEAAQQCGEAVPAADSDDAWATAADVVFDKGFDKGFAGAQEGHQQ